MKALLALPVALGATALALWSCDGEPSLSGSGEPIFVHGATFIQGELPGGPPITDGGPPASPAVTQLQTLVAAFRPGQAGLSFTGDVTDDATSIAVRFPDAGTGYWVFVPSAPDVTDPGNLSWSMTFDVNADAPMGVNSLVLAAVDANGSSGTQYAQPVCIDRPFPDNYNVCVPSRAPPDAVLSLAWDTPVDLNLILVTPSGVTVTPSNPTTASSPDAGTMNVGELDRNSGASCVADGLNREDIIWAHGAPEPGTYLAYADLFSACGQSSVRFTLTLYVSVPIDGGYTLAQVSQTAGELLAIQANGGTSNGLYLTDFIFPLTLDGGAADAAP